MSRFEDRRNKLRRRIKQLGADSMLVTDFVNVTYLTGFTGDDSYLWLTADKAVMLSDTRYDEQLESECPDIERMIRSTPVTMREQIQDIAKRTRCKALGFESCSLPHAQYEELRESLPKVDLCPTSGEILRLREIKDKDEIREIREAVPAGGKGVRRDQGATDGRPDRIGDRRQPGTPDRTFGGKGCSFSPIVAVGPRAALPHARPTEQRIEAAPLVLIDWGATSAGGYMSDLTRVLATAKNLAQT